MLPQLADEKAVRRMKLRQKRRIALVRQLQPLRDRERLRRERRMRLRKGQRHGFVFFFSDGAGTVEQRAAGLYIAADILQNGPLHLGQARDRVQRLIADIRLFPDDAKAGARHIGNDEIERVFQRRVILRRVSLLRLQDGNSKAGGVFHTQHHSNYLSGPKQLWFLLQQLNILRQFP